MGRIFLSAGHGDRINGVSEPGAIIAGTTEAREMIMTRDLVVAELRSRGAEVLSVPDELSPRATYEWINSRGSRTDVALEIRANAYSDPSVRGATVYYIANNNERKSHADLVLRSLVRRVPQLPSRGIQPDTATPLGSLGFCRQLVPPALLMEVGFLTNSDDRLILQNQRRDLAAGIADGLITWSRTVSGLVPTPTLTSTLTSTPTPTSTLASTAIYEEIAINLNGQIYGEKGILVSGSAFIPIDLSDKLGIDLSTDPNTRRINYRGVVFVRAVDLRTYNVVVGWDIPSRTVMLRSILRICAGSIDRIMSPGATTEANLSLFLKNNNAAALTQFPDIAKLYREECIGEGVNGIGEGVNHDIAFSQMCLETDFLRFGGIIKPSQNNFAGLGDVAGTPAGASFPSARIGVRAHIQLLKAYASTAPIVKEIVNPRFNFVTRGVAPLVDQLSGRWAADLQYGAKITAILRRLYESAQIL
ncbi:cell wall hydrolase [Phormidesmis priestleyi ULC007]|uniref:Cell wall hydrolase n=1 Tax=Phormidesmis priestleyi ULC007 TaxID=1920490 RepID=A0A2T1DHZ5_9CYAN|nr:N-acetylmuramoyl-L-alanine amidase [Phormidesmis priestleyi]PSB20102.1 cell wall hydrolase [Phormidesmis priestleyi ULC007]PZO48966.1 MAG: cell wall hydrolase [Phormidesmis priestleyi]